MTRERCSEGWAVDKLRMVNQIKTKHRKWTPGVAGTIDKDKYNRNVIGSYDYKPIQNLADWRTGCCSTIHCTFLFLREAPLALC